MPLTPHSTTIDHPPIGCDEGAIQPPSEELYKAVLQGGRGKGAKQHGTSLEHRENFSRSTTPIPLSTHVDFRARHVNPIISARSL